MAPWLKSLFGTHPSYIRVLPNWIPANNVTGMQWMMVQVRGFLPYVWGVVAGGEKVSHINSCSAESKRKGGTFCQDFELAHAHCSGLWTWGEYQTILVPWSSFECFGEQDRPVAGKAGGNWQLMRVW